MLVMLKRSRTYSQCDFPSISTITNFTTWVHKQGLEKDKRKAQENCNTRYLRKIFCTFLQWCNLFMPMKNMYLLFVAKYRNCNPMKNSFICITSLDVWNETSHPRRMVMSSNQPNKYGIKKRKIAYEKRFLS